MNGFSDDECFAFFASAAAAVISTHGYYAKLARMTPVGRTAPTIRLGLAAIPPVGLAILIPMLCRLAAREVVNHTGYILLFTFAGVAWTGLARLIAVALGISFRDDAIDRRNPAAATAVAGAMLGLTCAYAGANVGEGASIRMTFGPAVLATVAWAAAWAVLQRLTDLADAIAIERDVAAGARLTTFLILSGILFGRAVAGDYHSTAETFRDFAQLGWPVLPLIAVAAIVERTIGRRRRHKIGGANA